ncbi:hypothetical protein SBA1_710027 [Candidatus Sulfotelmatobacter kueseliae]|uniref:Uncharacterized protein n=1 Tax=Candidatus Sulfotelmatobacter kueseliae TaxID=2042962 RepID=A0A2U3L5C0_9BACT|nr:hypothetical protein SBA1_710027 [Candidatus Sulfotelmatobacter kueseliae]
MRRELGLVVQFGNKGSYQGIALAMPPVALDANGFSRWLCPCIPRG